MPPLIASLLLLIFFNAKLEANELNGTVFFTLFQATYTAKFNGMPITAQRNLTKEENGYRLTTSAKNWLGNMRETELFHVDTQGRIRIDDYVSKRSFLGSKRTEKLTIDHIGNKATFTRKKKKRETALLPEYLGPVSYQLQLSRDLQQPNAPLSYLVISHGKVKQYQFERIHEEHISTALGDINALKVRRVRKNNDRETVFWMAPEWNYLPIKIWQKESDGEVYEMTLKSVIINNSIVLAQ